MSCPVWARCVVNSVRIALIAVGISVHQEPRESKQNWTERLAHISPVDLGIPAVGH
jgi:hypothetical protein